MKINVSYLENEIELVSEYVVSIEIENKKYFYRLVHELYNIYQGIISSEVTFYDDSHQEINYTNKIKVFINFFDFQLDSKKYINDISKYIENNITWDTIFAAVSFLLSALTANYDSFFMIPSIIIKYFFIVIGVLYLFKIGKEFMTKKYNYENLINDINNLDLVAHRHSLVIIKNKDKYLLYDDERWQCKLFINYKTKDENNETAIKEALEKDLQLDTSTINCEFVTSRTQEKYSVSHNENRIYNHNLYSITLSKLPAYMKKDNFVINNKHYYWMTMDEMLSDSNIKEKNLEVVYFVKDSIS